MTPGANCIATDHRTAMLFRFHSRTANMCHALACEAIALFGGGGLFSHACTYQPLRPRLHGTGSARSRYQIEYFQDEYGS